MPDDPFVREKFTRERTAAKKLAIEVGDVDHLKVFANDEAAEKWFEEHEPEGVRRGNPNNCFRLSIKFYRVG